MVAILYTSHAGPHHSSLLIPIYLSIHLSIPASTLTPTPAFTPACIPQPSRVPPTPCHRSTGTSNSNIAHLSSCPWYLYPYPDLYLLSAYLCDSPYSELPLLLLLHSPEGTTPLPVI